MNAALKRFGPAAAAIVLATSQTVAFAQQSSWGILVTYAPVTAAPIPTLSEWGMAGLSLILAAVAIYALRNRAGGKPLASVMLAIALALGGLHGNNLMGEAKAITNADCPVNDLACPMVNAGGGSITSQRYRSDVAIENQTGVAQTITGVSAISPSDNSDPPDASPRCVVGLVVLPTARCYIFNSGGAPA